MFSQFPIVLDLNTDNMHRLWAIAYSQVKMHHARNVIKLRNVNYSKAE